MSNEPSRITLLGAVGALTLGLGISAAQSAPVIHGLYGRALTEGPIPVVDIKAGVDAGLGNGAVGAHVGVSADGTVGNAGVNAGADVGVAAGAGTNTGADADTDASADVNADGATDGTSASGGTTASGGVGADAADSVGSATSSPIRRCDAEECAYGASATVDLPPAAPPRISPLLPLISPGAHQAEAAVNGAESYPRQQTVVECVGRVVNGVCPTSGITELGALPQPKFPQPEMADSGSSDVSNGAAALSPSAATPDEEQSAALSSRGLGISLIDPKRTSNGLLVQGAIVNASDQSQAVPPMEIILLNSLNQVVQRSVLRAPFSGLAQGERKAFKLLVRPLPPNVSRVTVRFSSTATL